MQKILVSACLLGEKVRYDGGDNLLQDERWLGWQREGRLLPLCPECAGGLSTPRAAAERVGDRVITRGGIDVSEEFALGAEWALALAQGEKVAMAILKARSPSCGSGQIYDGSFSKKLVDGDGVTAALLKAHGIKVFTEAQLDEAAAELARLESN
ncbi:DUF523 domain-containing protein [Shewanella cyperi]|uniref:DUF523 domain-containing protein n=1 Tax=Shewanella cyperi TaxID=2814292 RepID=A0A975AK57_9GAMM|nr:DUF523 domain-containing protein [Shewanella cyperi]QSX29805.1 DUF523 domain-containing protein [Shewanella cyperi]QSX40588.1 DUF523 domain-containing protein [Shewanella cyperi]